MLATAGVAVGHIVGYGVAHPGSAAREAALGGHAYLPAAASVLIPLGVASALVWAVRTSRQLGLRGRIRFGHLAAAQVGVFLSQEVLERAASGIPVSDVLTERGVWFGLLAQGLVAWLSTRAVDGVRRAARFVRTGARLVSGTPRPALTFVPVPVLRSSPVVVAVGSRAPPAVSAFR